MTICSYIAGFLLHCEISEIAVDQGCVSVWCFNKQKNQRGGVSCWLCFMLSTLCMTLKHSKMTNADPSGIFVTFVMLLAVSLDVLYVFEWPTCEWLVLQWDQIPQRFEQLNTTDTLQMSLKSGVSNIVLMKMWTLYLELVIASNVNSHRSVLFQWDFIALFLIIVLLWLYISPCDISVNHNTSMAYSSPDYWSFLGFCCWLFACYEFSLFTVHSCQLIDVS